MSSQMGMNADQSGFYNIPFYGTHPLHHHHPNLHAHNLHHHASLSPSSLNHQINAHHHHHQMSASSAAAAAAIAAAAASIQQHQSDIDIDPRELEIFAEKFKQRRIKLGVTQADVGQQLSKLKIPGVGSLSQSTICRFESLTLSHNNMVALKPVLQSWLEQAESDARIRRRNDDSANNQSTTASSSTSTSNNMNNMNHNLNNNGSSSNGPSSNNINSSNSLHQNILNHQMNSSLGTHHGHHLNHSNHTSNSSASGGNSASADRKRKRTSIAAPEKRSLEAFFSVQPRPSGEKISQIADKLDLKKNVVRVWFCNQRQKQKRMKFAAIQGR
jgi:hypothetical protein